MAGAPLPKQLRFHDLRHPCAALLIANGRHMEEMKRSPRALAESGHVRSVRAPFPADSPRGSTTPTGMQPRPAGPTRHFALRLSMRGRLETLNRAFSGGCEYPSRNRSPTAPEGGGGRPGQGSPAFLASAPKQVMRRTNPGQVGSVLPHPRAYCPSSSVRYQSVTTANGRNPYPRLADL